MKSSEMNFTISVNSVILGNTEVKLIGNYKGSNYEESKRANYSSLSMNSLVLLDSCRRVTNLLI